MAVTENTSEHPTLPEAVHDVAAAAERPLPLPVVEVAPWPEARTAHLDPAPAAPDALRGCTLLAVGVAVADAGACPDDVDDDLALPVATRAVARLYGVDLARVVEQESFSGKGGEVLRVPVQSPAHLPRVLLLVGLGRRTATDFRRAGAALARAAVGEPAAATTLVVDAPGPVAGGCPPAGTGRAGDGTAQSRLVRAFVEGLVLGGHAPAATGLRHRDLPCARWALLGDDVDGWTALGLHEGLVLAGAGVRARELALVPSDVKTPDWMARQAQRRGLEAGLDVRVWDEHDLAADGFRALLAVGAASQAPPRLVRLDHRPPGVEGDPVVLVGKGITYDTGGLAVKPRESMVSMKTDMSGAGAVLATMLACRDAGVRVPVTGLLPLAENALGAASYRPGDVVRPFAGPSVEVLNTDAEGRLVLADALSYAATTLAPRLLVDVATLTGAVTLGLGRRHAGLYTTSADEAQAFALAGDESGERVWHLPLVGDYRGHLDSPVADVTQVTRDKHVRAGSVLAALFLREYVGQVPWVHLDIAGTARSDAASFEVPKGPTGFGARLLLQRLLALQPA